MVACTAPVRGHTTVSGAASCPVHGARSSGEQVIPAPVASPVVEPSVRVEPLPNGGQREEWLVEGRRHRTDGPAVVERNDAGVVVREAWFVESRLHRVDGPAYVERNDAGEVVHEQWFVEDRLHRTDGPAVVMRNAAGVVTLEWWRVEGKDITPAEVFGLFLADKGAKDLSVEALEFLGRNRRYEQWGEITADEIALARLLHPVTEVG